MFTHTSDILEDSGFGHVFLFGGGGGTILPHEIEHLKNSGIGRIYSPEDGRTMGLVGMVKDAMEEAGKINLMDASRFESLRDPVSADDHASVSKLLTMAENSTEEEFEKTLTECAQ